MPKTDLIAHINGFEIAKLREDLDHAPEPANGPSKATIIEESIAWIERIRTDITSLLTQIDEGDDLDMAVAIQYVELKSRWIAFNTKINYETFRKGTPSVSDMCRAASISAFLGHIEPLLRTADVEHITDFLAQPLSNAA